MSVGENIKKLRECKSLTLAEFASMTGMDEQTCESIEAGKRPLTSSEVHTICKALDVTFDMLVATPKPVKKASDDEVGGSVVMPIEELQNLLGKMKE